MSVAAARKAPPAAIKESAPKVVEAAKSTRAVSLSSRQASTTKGPFPTKSLAVTFPKAFPRPDDIAVIIGNADYSRLGKDIPNVVPAYADAQGFKQYVIDALGVRDGNIIDLRDATGSQMERVFGNDQTHKGQLFDWVKPNVSRVYIYYSGHGAPGGEDGTAYLVPSDADASRIHINGFPLKTLYRNLEKIPATSTTVVLEACFSGMSQAGSLLGKMSPVFLKPNAPDAPSNVTVISAGTADQVATWEEDSSHGLFTKYFLKAMSGEADAKPYGNGNGQVDYDELDAYLKGTMTYYSRRYYGRDQTAQIVVAKPR